DDCNRKTRLCVGSAKTRLMATDETEKQQKQNPEPFRVGSVSAFHGNSFPSFQHVCKVHLSQLHHQVLPPLQMLFSP
ncbi:MAG: hypothetical protein QW177_10105, partial [Candidatus Nitrosotenuis sp.]